MEILKVLSGIDVLSHSRPNPNHITSTFRGTSMVDHAYRPGRDLRYSLERMLWCKSHPRLPQWRIARALYRIGPKLVVQVEWIVSPFHMMDVSTTLHDGDISEG